QTQIKAILASDGFTKMGGSAVHASGNLSQLAGSANAAAVKMFYAEQQAHGLAAAINALHSKTIEINTIEHTSVYVSKKFGVTGQALQQGGVIPGFSPGRDIVPAMLSPGESVLNPYATRMLGADWVHAVNSMAERGTANPAALRHGMSGGVNPG